tara:strand:- start:400 stop:1356 length:957 start_codon:yes stop_codon:yes gene_type:complete
MRNISQTPRGKWQVRLRHAKGNICKNFSNLNTAKKFLKEQEAKLELGMLVQKQSFPMFTTLIDKYIEKKSKHKKGYEYEKYVLNKIKELNMFKKPLDKITTKVLAEYRDYKLETCKTSTVKRHFNILKHIFTICITEWEYDIMNPFIRLAQLKEPVPRDRRFTEQELNQLLRGNRTPPQMRTIIELAIETSLRRKEILGIKAEHLKGNILFVPPENDKIGLGKHVPLSVRAVQIISNADLPFTYSRAGFDSAWRRLAKAYNLKNLQFRDSRHEAVSRMFEDKRMLVPEVQACTGHSNPKVLLRVYANLNKGKVAEKLG